MEEIPTKFLKCSLIKSILPQLCTIDIKCSTYEEKAKYSFSTFNIQMIKKIVLNAQVYMY